ncbi:hypothetical protein STEG23_023342, partial [Scotinomys teguina]
VTDINTDPGCNRVMDPDTAFGSSRDLVITMDSEAGQTIDFYIALKRALVGFSGSSYKATNTFISVSSTPDFSNYLRNCSSFESVAL